MQPVLACLTDKGDPVMSTGKIFCIGFQKTGTSSLRDALRKLGFTVTGTFGGNLPLDELRATYVATGLQIAEVHDAVEDMPWALMFRELDEAFPGSRFILTVRNTDRWYKSITSHFGANPHPMQQLTYGDDAGAPVGHEARYREVYEAHNAAVRDHFRSRPQHLLEMSLEDGHGWPELCRFLGVENVPPGPFVHTNSAAQRKTLANRMRSRLFKWGFPVKVMSE